MSKHVIPKANKKTMIPDVWAVNKICINKSRIYIINVMYECNEINENQERFSK